MAQVNKTETMMMPKDDQNQQEESKAQRFWKTIVMWRMRRLNHKKIVISILITEKNENLTQG